MSIESFNNVVVSKYVGALYEVSAGRELEFLEQVKIVREALGSVENYSEIFKRFSLLPKDGEALINTLISELKLFPEIGNFLKLVLSNKRFSEILDICEAYEKFYDLMNGKKVFYITYAKKFSHNTEAELTKRLQELFGGTIGFVTHRDDSLIDGLQIRYGSKVLDYSIRSKLERLKKSMKGEGKI